jgi:hypothetical protein
MINDPIVQRLNKFLDTHVFTIPLLDEVDDPDNFIDIKLKITGEKKLISVGEWKDYYTYTIIVLPTKSRIANLIFKDLLSDGIEIDLTNSKYGVITFRMTRMTNNLLYNLFEYYTIDRSVIATKMVINNNEQINESLMLENSYDGMTRKIVKDIVNVFKTKKEGVFNLPEDLSELSDFMTYDFGSKLNSFSVSLELIKNNDVKDFIVDGDYYRDEETINVEIIYNPNMGNKLLFKLIGELNEVVRHELEHIKQYISGYKFPKYNPKTFYGYYNRPYEIEAQIAGFKRRAKIEKKDIKDVAKEWFDSNKERHNLSSSQIKKLIDKITS